MTNRNELSASFTQKQHIYGLFFILFVWYDTGSQANNHKIEIKCEMNYFDTEQEQLDGLHCCMWQWECVGGKEKELVTI